MVLTGMMMLTSQHFWNMMWTDINMILLHRFKWFMSRCVKVVHFCIIICVCM